MATIRHGVRVLERTETNNYIQTIETATIAIVATADNADASVFPLLTPVKIAGFDEATLAAMGTSGTLRKVVDAIASQGYAPLMAVIRVPEDAANQAAKVAEGVAKIAEIAPVHDFTPRLLGAPGLDAEASVVNALTAQSEKIGAYVYCGLNAVSKDDALLEAAAGQFNNENVMPVWPDLTSGGERVYAAAVALGLRARIDNDHPQSFGKTISNVSIKGVDGVTTLVDWDLQGSSGTAAAELNNAHVTTIVKHSGAFRFWGNRSGDGQFESSVRIKNVLQMLTAQAQLARLDQPMSQALIEDIVFDVEDRIGSMRTAGILINGAVWLDPGWNSASVIEQGGIYIHYDFTPPPPLENITLVSTVTGKYLLEALPSWLQTDTGTSTPTTDLED